MTIILFLCSLLLVSVAQAQYWAGGSPFTDQKGTYNNSLGSSNIIGSRADMACWSDMDYGFIAFGGYGWANSTTIEPGYLADVWEFYNETMWKYLQGSTTIEAPGNLNISLGSLYPGSRKNSMVWRTSTDLWVFGGFGMKSGPEGEFELGALDDVWSYNCTTDTWTLRNNGSSIVDDLPPINLTSPAPREGAYSWFVPGADGQQTLWMFGGISNEEEYNSDMWSYDMIKNIWTWRAGANQTGVPPTLNVGPSARSKGASWVDENGGLYLFGGHSVDAQEIEQLLNDIWKFNTSTLQWENIQLPSINLPDRPSPRFSPSFTSDSRGNLFVFGGKTSANEELSATMNDLWVYEPSTNQWRWLLGSNITNSKGNYNEITRYGQPASRASGCLWIDFKERLWLFGGENGTEDGGLYNDYWRLVYLPDIFPKFPTLPPTNGFPTGFPTGFSTTGKPSTQNGTGSSTSGTTFRPITIGTTGGASSGNETNSLTSGSVTHTPFTTGFTSAQSLTSSSTGGFPNITTTFITSGPHTTSGNSTHHPVSKTLIVGTILGSGVTVCASAVGLLWLRGNSRVRNMFRRRDADDDLELLPLNRRTVN